MATVKVKLRESTVGGKPGVIHYQLWQGRKSQQIKTGVRLFPHQWDARHERVVIPLSDEGGAMLALQQRIDSETSLLYMIMRNLQSRPEGCLLGDVAVQFQRSRSRSVLMYIETLAAGLETNGRLGTARNYRRTLNSFSDFLDGRDIPLYMFDERLVGRYDDWLRRRRVVRNTVSFYMRILRAVFNKAVKEELALPAQPFRHVYTGIDNTRKRAVDERVIHRMNRLDLSGSPALSFARDLFIFSYGTRGMAFVDMAYLRKSDICDDMLRYARQKTGQQLSVRLESCTKAIAARYGGRPRSTPYLFPILSCEEPVRAYAQYHVALNYYNRLLKKLSKLLGLEQGLSSYTSRHSWATAARNHHVPLSVISAGMGHASERTTQIYLMKLENSVIDHANREILAALDRHVSL